jgi:hypothetical protein
MVITLTRTPLYLLDVPQRDAISLNEENLFMLRKLLIVAGITTSLAPGVIWGSHQFAPAGMSWSVGHQTVAAYGHIRPDGIIWGD